MEVRFSAKSRRFAAAAGFFLAQLCISAFVLTWVSTGASALNQSASQLSADAASAKPRTGGFASAWVSGNFDGDTLLDWVVARPSVRKGHRFDLLFHFDQRPDGPLALRNRIAPQKLLARDIDGDTDTDLVLETLSSEPIAVWLNDGKGHFEEADVDRYRKSPALSDSLQWGSRNSALPADVNFEDAVSPVLAGGVSHWAPRLLRAASGRPVRWVRVAPPSYRLQARGPPVSL